MRELTKEALLPSFDQLPEFETTNDIEPYCSIIGQERAVKAIDLGLQMEKMGYNIFISGRSGTGKTSYILRKIEEYAKTRKTPEDWCYVFNMMILKNPLP